MIEKIKEIISAYEKQKLRGGVVGSHSALEIASGLKQEDFEVVVVCERGREKTYLKHYKNLFDYNLLLDKFSDVLREENQEKLRRLNTIWIANRSFSTYVGWENIENKFFVPNFGNRYLLKIEERNVPRNQYYLLEKAGIKTPKIFKSKDEIDRFVIVKLPEKQRKTERGDFCVSSPEEFEKKAEERIEKGIITREDLDRAVIEEYVLGAKFNANFFWSPLVNELDLLGFDQRIQTNLNGILDLPAKEQLGIEIPIQIIEAGHRGVTARERLLEIFFEAAEKFVEICKKEYPPGIIGPFALQGAITKDLEFYTFDVSPRPPGSPCLEPTSPYMKYKYGKPVGVGQRIAIEIKRAVQEGRLEEIMT